MAGEVVHDDHNTGAQFGYQDLRHIGFEPVAIDRPVENHRRDHADHAKASDQRRGLAMAIREVHPQPLASRASTMAAGHVGGGPGLSATRSSSTPSMNTRLSESRSN